MCPSFVVTSSSGRYWLAPLLTPNGELTLLRPITDKADARSCWAEVKLRRLMHTTLVFNRD